MENDPGAMSSHAESNAVPASSERQYTITQFAEAAGTSTRRVRRMIQQGRLRTWITPSGETRIPEGELKRLERRRERQPVRLALAPIEATEIAKTRLVPLKRHEAAMVRLGLLESELTNLREQHQDLAEREANLRCRVDTAEEEAVEATVRAVEAEAAIEELRAQVVESTLKAMEAQAELKRFRNQSWWQRIFG
jgi:hypothetical protein